MIWFFERQHSKLRYEVRRQPDGHDYELVITGPDGSQNIEQYADALTLLDRMQALERALRADGWHAPVVGAAWRSVTSRRAALPSADSVASTRARS